MEQLKPLERLLKRFVFRVASLVLKEGRADFQPLDGSGLQRVLFLRPEKIGDMVISYPVFDGLTDRYPHIKISLLGSPRNRPLIDGDPRFEKIFMYTKNVWLDFKTILRMRKERYDCVVDMICDDSVTALFLSQLIARGNPRVGVGKVKFREYYDFNYDHRMGNTGHIIDNTLKLLEAFGIDSGSVNPYAHPYLPDSATNVADTFVDSVKADIGERPIVGYNMSAGAPNRIWAPEKSLELVKRLTEHGLRPEVLLFTVGSDRARADKLMASHREHVRQVPEGMSLLEASALIRRLNLIITPDTSLVHIARAFQVPVVGLYSRFMKNFLLWRPFGQELGAIVSNNDHNIFDITVDQVIGSFGEVMRNRQEVSP